MKLTRLVTVLGAISLAGAQGDLLSSILSDAQSIYTAVTSILAPSTASTTSSSSSATSTSSSDASTTSSTSSSFSSSSTSSSSTSSTSSSSSSSTITATPLSSPAITGTPTSVAAAAASSPSNGAASGSNNGGGSNLLAIVLGCTLGALAIAAFLALLWLCLRRRKKNKNSTKHRAVSPDDDEIDSWRHAKPYVRSEKGMHETTTPMINHSAAPSMSERSPPRMHSQHQNPFVPVPPPARRSSRQGLNDSTEYSAHPYSPDHYPNHHDDSYHTTRDEHDGHHALEAGLAGAALGGLAAHARDRHERKRSESRGRSTHEKVPFSESEHNALPEAHVEERRSGDVARANVKEPWPFMQDQRRSMDTSRSRSRSFSRGDDHFVTPSQTPSEPMPSHAGFASAAAIGGIAGTAAQRRATAHSPHRKGILKNTNSHFSTSSSSSNDQPQSRSPVSDLKNDRDSTGPHELASADVPMPFAQRERRNSALGTAAPLAAAAAHTNRPRSGSGGSRTSLSRLSLTIPDEEQNPPLLPSRSPNRHSLDSRARYTSANEGTAELPSDSTRQPTEMPLHHKKQSIVSPPLEPLNVTENSGLMSPISPVTEENGSWSKAQAEQFGISHTGLEERTVSQESTAVGSPPAEKHIDDTSDNSSSGLVSAIQKIFSSQKSAWDDRDDDVEIFPTLNRKHGARDLDQDRPRRSVPRRKAAPGQNPAQLHSQYGELAQTDLDEPQIQPVAPQHDLPRKSIDSSRSLPPRYSKDTSMTATSMHDFAPSTPTSTAPTRPRAHSRSGYGIGSGDPFDLARVRTDSSMTGISLANYVEPAQSSPSRPRPYRTSTGSSSSQKEPTLADLRRQVMAEDRERARQSWRRSQSRERTNSVGRFGDDREFFNLIDETTGTGRFYADNGQGRRKSQGQGEVGWAY